MMKNIHVLLGIMCMHFAMHAMVSSDVPDWKIMCSSLEAKYQDYLKSTLNKCKKTNAIWHMDDLIKIGKAITKQDDVTLKSVICGIHDEQGFTFAHTLVEDPDKLFELIKQNYICFGQNKHNVAALDYAIKNLEAYIQDGTRITSDPEGFERASCGVHILLNYVKMMAFRHSVERATSDDFGPCCEKHTFPEDLDFIESELVKSDMIALLDEYSNPLEEQKLVNNFFGCNFSNETIVPVFDSKESESDYIVVLSDEHMASKETGFTFVPFGQKLKPFTGEPKNGSKMIVKYYNCYLWGIVRGKAVNNDIGIIVKKKDGVPCGNIFSLQELYELVEQEEK